MIVILLRLPLLLGNREALSSRVLDIKDKLVEGVGSSHVKKANHSPYVLGISHFRQKYIQISLQTFHITTLSLSKSSLKTCECKL